MSTSCSAFGYNSLIFLILYYKTVGFYTNLTKVSGFGYNVDRKTDSMKVKIKV